MCSKLFKKLQKNSEKTVKKKLAKEWIKIMGEKWLKKRSKNELTVMIEKDLGLLLFRTDI